MSRMTSIYSCSKQSIAPLLTSLLVMAPSAVMAQTAGGSQASQESQFTGGDLALISYVVLWVLVLAVVLVVFNRQKKLNEELETLEAKIDAQLGVNGGQDS